MGSLHLLLVEDNAGDAGLITAMLEGHDVQLEHVTSLDAGVQRLTEGGLDAVLLDLGLPDSQGLESVKTTHLFDSETPIIVLTGLDDDDAAFEALRSGAQDYLVKGTIDGRAIVRTVRFAQQRAEAQARLEKKRDAPAASDAAIRALAAPAGSGTVAAIGQRIEERQAGGHPVLYVAFDRPAGVLRPRYMDLGLGELHFIDASGDRSEGDSAIYTLDDPRDLDAVAVAIENGCAGLGPDTHVVVDNVNAIILQHGVDAAAVFGHAVANRLRVLGISADFVGHNNQEWPFILDRFSFLDGELQMDTQSSGADPAVA